MTVSNQIGPLSTGPQPYVNQQNFGQMTGECNSYNPGMSASLVQNFINNALREYYDRRMWYGLMVKGQIVAPGYYSTGTVSLTYGSATVYGSNTNWAATLGGAPIIQQQLRVGFTAPIYNIIACDPVAQTLTLEMPWGNPTLSTSGYFITQYYYSFPNIKYFYSIKNLQLMYRLWTNVPQNLLENWDPSRLQLMYPRVVATMPPDVNGNYQVELWPAPNIQQALPYLAYAQPPNLVNDSDQLPPYIRADVVKQKAIADVLMYRPKANVAYSESVAVTIAEAKRKEFEAGLFSAAQADEALFRQDIVLVQEQMPYAQLDWGSGMLLGGGYMAAMTAQMAGGMGEGDY